VTGTDLLELRIAGLLAMAGAVLYILGDVLLLAVKASPERHPNLASHAKLLGGSERMAELATRRIVPGGLLGVFATPLVLFGWWQLYRGLELAGPLAALGPALLFGAASVVGAFVHGWFMAIADGVRLLDAAPEPFAPAVAEVVARQRRVLVLSYAPVIGAVLVATTWFAVVVLAGATRFPAWLGALNPVTLLIAFLLVRRVLPASIADRLEGAGFNVAYLAFFALTTATIA
jgi:hypothetical protein